MKKNLIMTLGIVMTPVYLGAYILSNLLCFKGREDMESPKEWLSLMLSPGETGEDF